MGAGLEEHRSFGWVDNVKQALGMQDFSVEAANERAMDRSEWKIIVDGRV